MCKGQQGAQCCVSGAGGPVHLAVRGVVLSLRAVGSPRAVLRTLTRSGWARRMHPAAGLGEAKLWGGHRRDARGGDELSQTRGLGPEGPRGVPELCDLRP